METPMVKTNQKKLRAAPECGFLYTLRLSLSVVSLSL
jgi:hypothetical protein